MRFLLFTVLVGFSLGLIVACKTVEPKTTTTTVTTSTIDTLPIIFTPDPFSSLVNLETRFGIMKIELFFETPKHRENFLKLAKDSFYHDLLFHRVMKNFMVQGGDPNSKNAKPNQRLGADGPGYDLDAEMNNNYYHIKGALAAARQPDEVNPQKKSSGSQFYIVHGGKVTDDELDRYERSQNIIYSPAQRRMYKKYGGAPQLDMNYTVFGRVYEGFHVIDSIAVTATDNYNRPKQDVKMKVKIIKE